jgi:hypothetical protein
VPVLYTVSLSRPGQDHIFVVFSEGGHILYTPFAKVGGTWCHDVPSAIDTEIPAIPISDIQKLREILKHRKSRVGPNGVIEAMGAAFVRLGQGPTPGSPGCQVVLRNRANPVYLRLRLEEYNPPFRVDFEQASTQPLSTAPQWINVFALTPARLNYDEFLEVTSEDYRKGFSLTTKELFETYKRENLALIQTNKREAVKVGWSVSLSNSDSEFVYVVYMRDNPPSAIEAEQNWLTTLMTKEDGMWKLENPETALLRGVPFIPYEDLVKLRHIAAQKLVIFDSDGSFNVVD